MPVRLDTADAFLCVLSALALLYALYHAIRERLQSGAIKRLRDDARLLRNSLVNNEDLDPDVRQLLMRFNPSRIVASDSIETINKRNIYVCVEPDTRASDAENHAIMLFSLIHEMAHVMTPEYGHGSNFWQNFDVLLARAHQIGLYDRDVLNAALRRSPAFQLCDHRVTTAYLP